MIECGGVFLPDGETHLVDWMTRRNQWVDGRLTYQFHKLEAALKYCTDGRTAVDVGAHVGLWSMHLVQRFDFVHAFEPIEAHRQCFERNVQAENVMLYPCALGQQDGRVSIRTDPTSSGDSYVVQGDDVPVFPLDGFDLSDVDFIKLDCEGYELFALAGGVETLERCRPVVCVEQKPGKAQKYGIGETDAVKFLQRLGAKLRAEMSGDYILTF